MTEYDKELIAALTYDYKFVFRVKIDQDLLEVIKINGNFDESLIGLSVDNSYSSLMSKYIQKRLHPEDREKQRINCSVQNIRNVLSQKDVFRGKYRIIDNGEIHHFKYKFVRISAAGEPLQAITAITNIDDTEAESHKKMTELERMRTILASSNMGVWQLTLEDGKAPRLSGDPKFMELLGISPDSQMNDEEIFDYFRPRVSPEDEEAFNQYDQRLIEDKRAEITYRWIHPTLGQRYVRCGGTSMKTAEGYSFSGYHYDITEQKEKEIQTQQMLEDNIAANKAKTQFLQNMSHEIRTPLNAMFGFAQLLSMPEGSWTEEERQEYSSHIFNSYNMLDMLIGDIIDVADSEHGNYRIELSEVHVNEICRNALMSVEYRKPFEVNLYYTTDLTDDYSITSDGRRIQQVLINYLTNACKYTHEGEIRLHCSTSEHPGKLTFSVTDTGVGIPDEKADMVFNRFTKLNQFVQGSGLGLNICQMVASKLGGDVYLDKTYKKGARFVFVIDNR